MSVYCMNPEYFVESLDLETLYDLNLFAAAVEEVENSHGEDDRAYWDGSPWDARRAQLAK